MGFNRFSGMVNSEYVPLPLDKLLQAGLYLDDKMQKTKDAQQAGLDTLHNMPSWGEADTKKKQELMNNLNTQVNQLASKNYNDPLVQNQINQLIYQTANSPEVQTILSHSALAPKYFEDEKSWIKQYGTQESFLTSPRSYLKTINDEFTLDPTGTQFRNNTGLDSYDDYREPLTKLAKDMKANGYTYTTGLDGAYIFKHGNEELKGKSDNPNEKTIDSMLKSAVNDKWLTSGELNTLYKDAAYYGIDPADLLGGVFNTLDNTYSYKKSSDTYEGKNPGFWDTPNGWGAQPKTPPPMNSYPGGLTSYKGNYSNLAGIDANGNVYPLKTTSKSTGIGPAGSIPNVIQDYINSQGDGASILKDGIAEFRSKFPSYSSNLSDNDIAKLLIAIDTKQRNVSHQRVDYDSTGIIDHNKMESALLSTPSLTVVKSDGSQTTVDKVIGTTAWKSDPDSHKLFISGDPGSIGDMTMLYNNKSTTKGQTSKSETVTVKGGLDYQKNYTAINQIFVPFGSIPPEQATLSSSNTNGVLSQNESYTIKSTPSGDSPTGYQQMVYQNLTPDETAYILGVDLPNPDDSKQMETYLNTINQYSKDDVTKIPYGNSYLPVFINYKAAQTSDDFIKEYVNKSTNASNMQQYKVK